MCEDLLTSGYHIIEYSRSASHPWSVSVDLSQPERAIEKITSSLKNVSFTDCEEILVIHNAGTIGPIGPSSKKPLKQVLANVNTNFTSPILAISLIIAHLQRAPCRKILAVVSSGAARKSYHGWSLYCAAKAGMESYVGALALEQQIEPNPFIPVIVDPNVIDTEMQATIRLASLEDFPDVERFQARNREGHLAKPKEVASRILKLLGKSDLRSGERYEV